LNVKILYKYFYLQKADIIEHSLYFGNCIHTHTNTQKLVDYSRHLHLFHTDIPSFISWCVHNSNHSATVCTLPL